MSTLDLSEYVRVTNRTGANIKARYDGKDYLFKDNDSTDVHSSAAAHIFGFGATDKTNAFHRLGWLSEMNYEMALEKLSDIEFTEVPNPAVSIMSGRPKAKRPKTSSPIPLANAGAELGEEDDSSPDEADDEAGAA
jgi:hypothetical protein